MSKARLVGKMVRCWSVLQSAPEPIPSLSHVQDFTLGFRPMWWLPLTSAMSKRFHSGPSLRASSGTYDSIDPVERNQFFVALNLSLLGDRARAEGVIDDYETLNPETERGIETRMNLFRLVLNVRIASGDTAGALGALVDAADAYGCSTCFTVEEARIAEHTGQVDEAIRRHETVVEGGCAFFELNGPHRLRSTLVLGPLYEQTGNTAKAIEAYQRVIDQWSNADARGMQTVQHARARIAALGG
jgi:hypothetical protein